MSGVEFRTGVDCQSTINARCGMLTKQTEEALYGGGIPTQ